MATLLELQELFRNISDPDVEQLLRTSPKESRWMVMDEKRRRAEMREAEKAALAESDIKPRNMLEEYQSDASSVLGGQPLGDIGQQDQGQYGEMESSGGLDPYADQQDGVLGFSPGGLIPVGAAIGRAAAASSIPWLAKLAQKLGARAVPQAPRAVSGAGRLPAGWTIGPNGVPMPPRGGVPGPAGRLSPPHPGDPMIDTPFGRIPGRGVNLPSGPTPGAGARPMPSGGPSAPAKTVAETAEAATKGNLITRHPYIAGGAGLLAANYMMGDDDEQASSLAGLGGTLADTDAPQGSDQYLKLLRRVMDRGDELQERIGDSRISTKDKIRRIGLAASGAMMSTPGPFGNAVGAAFTAASDEMGAISAEENQMLRTAISEYQVGSGSVAQLIAAIASINKSMNSGGRGGITKSMLIKIMNEEGMANIPEFLSRLAQAEAMVSGQGQVAQTDFDHSSIDSIYGTD